MATIVVVDYEASVRRVLIRSLRYGGHEVLDFECPEEALEEVDFGEVDLLITDLQMPMTGDQVIRQLRARGIQIPVLVVSGFLDPERVAIVENLGVEKILKKPFELDELLEAVEESLDVHPAFG